MKEAVGISIFQMLFSAIFGSYLNYKRNILKLDNSICVGIGGLIGACFSGFIVSMVSSKVLEIGLLISLIIAIIKFYKANINLDPKTPSNFILFIVGLLVGMFAISMGIGGALFLTPILVGFLGVDLKKAVCMGLFFVVFSSISGFISLAYNNHVNYYNGIILGIFSLCGVAFGINFSNKMEKNTQKKWLLFLYVAMFCLTLKKILEI